MNNCSTGYEKKADPSMANELPTIQSHVYYPAVTIDIKSWQVFDRHMNDRLAELERRFYTPRQNPAVVTASDRKSWTPTDR